MANDGATEQDQHVTKQTPFYRVRSISAAYFQMGGCGVIVLACLPYWLLVDEREPQYLLGGFGLG